MNTKSARLEVKDADAGTVVAVFSKLGVVDHDGDVTVKGAFSDGASVRISAYGHKSWEGKLPVGKGTIREVGDEAVMDGRFFLDTTDGRDTFAVVKELGDLQEWSYGYDAVKYSFGDHEGQNVRFLEELKVHEVSPVLLGAGIDTRTVSAKSGLKFAEHVESVVADVDTLVARATDVMALRAEKGKAIAGASADALGKLLASVKRLEELLAEPPTDTTADEIAGEYLRFVSLTQGAS